MWLKCGLNVAFSKYFQLLNYKYLLKKVWLETNLSCIFQ